MELIKNIEQQGESLSPCSKPKTRDTHKIAKHKIQKMYNGYK